MKRISPSKKGVKKSEPSRPPVAKKKPAAAKPVPVKKVSSVTKSTKKTAPAKAPVKAGSKLPLKKAAVKQAAPKKVAAPKAAAPAKKSPANAEVKKPAGLAQKVAQKIGKTVQKAIGSIATGAKSATRAVAKSAAQAATKATSAVKQSASKSPVKAPAKPSAKVPAKAVAPAVKRAPAPARTKTPSKTLRPKTFGLSEAEKSFGFPAETPELPESYGEDRLVLMTQDPEYLFTYWEITPEQRALSERAKRADEEYQEALRLNWTSADLFAPNFALLPVSLDARKGYLRVPFSGLSYQVEIGWVSNEGHFISILGRSNRSDAPESWKQTRSRLKKDAAHREVLEYNLRITQPLGSSELGRLESVPGGRSDLAGDWNFEGPGSLSSSASSGAVVRKIPPAKASAPVRPRSPAKQPSKTRR
jgi:hypothetical protein